MRRKKTVSNPKNQKPGRAKTASGETSGGSPDTSRSELQSQNEDLAARSARLVQKIGAEQQVSDDLDGILSSSGVAAIFLDKDFRILRFTAQIRELFNLTRKDLGREIGDFTGSLNDPNLSSDLAQAQRTLVPAKIDVQAEDGKWYDRRISPYPMQAEDTAGFMITYYDISELKQSQRKKLAARRFAEDIVNTIHDPMLVLDSDLYVIRPNRACPQLFGTADGIVGRHFFTLADGQWDIPRVAAQSGAGITRQHADRSVQCDNRHPRKRSKGHETECPQDGGY